MDEMESDFEFRPLNDQMPLKIIIFCKLNLLNRQWAQSKCGSIRMVGPTATAAAHVSRECYKMALKQHLLSGFAATRDTFAECRECRGSPQPQNIIYSILNDRRVRVPKVDRLKTVPARCSHFAKLLIEYFTIFQKCSFAAAAAVAVAFSRSCVHSESNWSRCVVGRIARVKSVGSDTNTARAHSLTWVKNKHHRRGAKKFWGNEPPRFDAHDAHTHTLI